MIDTLVLLVGAILRLFHSRRSLLLENIALRHNSRHETKASQTATLSLRYVLLALGAQVWDGSSCCDSVDENQVCPHFIRESLQNGSAERWVQSCRRDLLNHVIALNEVRLRRLLSHYVRYYHEDRTHLGLKKETPTGRIRSLASGCITARARLGGLHHRYDRAA